MNTNGIDWALSRLEPWSRSMRRSNALAYIRIAGYHRDLARFVRVYMENRISMERANKVHRAGVAAKASDVPCAYADCRTPIT